jgi:hypothetical protein
MEMQKAIHFYVSFEKSNFFSDLMLKREPPFPMEATEVLSK